jgi:hypothetical protein
MVAISLCATCPTHFIFLALTTLIIYIIGYKSGRSSLCSIFYCPAVTSSPYVQICPSAPCSESHTVCVLPLIWQIKFQTQTKPKEKLYIFIAYVSWVTKRQTDIHEQKLRIFERKVISKIYQPNKESRWESKSKN